MKPPAICIVGKDKRKKSALMDALITELKTRSMKVGALKYHKHGDFELDIEGKDTWKYAKAGADTVAIASSVKFAVIRKVRAEPEIDDILEKDFADCDIVLADGFTLSDKPRIIVTDSEEDIEVFKRGCEVAAVVGRNNEREDIQVIADTVVRFCGLKKPQTDYAQNTKSPISLREALEKINWLKNEYYFRRKSELVDLNDSIGRELSETIFADSMSPEFDIAAMDGFAVRSEDGYPLKISGSVYAGDCMAQFNGGEAMAIATGALLPQGADAVLKMEDAEVKKDHLFGKSLKKWENVFRAGSDYRKGDKIFEKNHRIMPQSAALLYSLGIDKVPVFRKIRTGIISTGTEIHNGMIKNTNAVLIHGFMKELGCDSKFIGTVPDDYDKTKKMMLEACEKYDAVFTTGGVSVGERDYVADIIAETGEIIFHRVAIRPGKPIAVGIINDTPVFSLPGKPTGAFAALEMVVRSYFTKIPRASCKLRINEDVALQEEGFSYILFVKIAQDMANTMGFRNSGMKLFEKEYETAIISASPRSTIVDGYVITDKDMKKDEVVEVHLFS